MVAIRPGSPLMVTKIAYMPDVFYVGRLVNVFSVALAVTMSC